MKYLIERLKERSTWLGLTALSAAFGWALSPEYQDAIAQAGIGIAALIGILTKERNADSKQ